VADFKPVLKPENSIIAGVAVVGLVWADYNLNLGSTTEVHASQPNHPVLETSRKKAGYSALVLVAAVGLLAKDPNIIILGGAAIIAMETSYRHAIMSNSDTGQLELPSASVYQTAQAVTPGAQQGDNVAAG
jgi:hypothetical protein